METDLWIRIWRISKKIAIGEYTPSYLFVPDAPEAMAKLLGTDLKFIVALRNPIDRAYSHYCHAVNNWSARKWQDKGYPIETGTFLEALIEEPARLTSGEYHIRHQSYFSKGLYALQLRRFFALFPRENFFVYIFEDFVREPRLILAELCQFLAVDQKFVFDDPETKVNTQTKGQLDPALRHQLQLAYQPANAELEKLIGRDLKLWNC